MYKYVHTHTEGVDKKQASAGYAAILDFVLNKQLIWKQFSKEISKPVYAFQERDKDVNWVRVANGRRGREQ